MRNIKLLVQMTLDGFVGGPNGAMDWLVNKYVKGILISVDTIILGRKPAEGFIPYWANVAANPEDTELSDVEDLHFHCFSFLNRIPAP